MVNIPCKHEAGGWEYDMVKAYKNLTGPGPCARISSIERGLQKKSKYQPKQLERSIKGKRHSSIERGA